MSAKHITELFIENFRGFDRLEFKGLQAVNLIVGENNAGKTSLLEALAMICEPENFKEMPGKLRPVVGNADKRYFRWLLRDSANVESGGIKATSQTGISHLWLNKASLMEFPSIPQIYSNPDLRVYLSEPSVGLKLRIVSVNHRHPTDLVASFGNAVRSRNGEELVHKILRKVDARILRVRVDPVEEGNIIAIDIGLSENIPLPQAGQGIYRLVALLSEVIGEKPQVCIIDEIENGLHYSVLKDVWRGIAEISKTLGVQFFITTHSRECLEAAQAVFFDEDKPGENDFAVIRMMRLKDRIEATLLNEERVEAALEANIELR